MAQLWGGRFSGKVDELMQSFNASISFDKRMAQVDCTGSKAYAKALFKRNLITETEKNDLIRGLDLVAEEWKKGVFDIQPSDEDIHTANERR